MSVFAPYSSKDTSFVVLNITPDSQKTIKVFNYPILYSQTRDLMKIPGIGSSDIKDSLIKGTLGYKIRAKDLEIIFSDIDLLEFNDIHRKFLKNAGVTVGTEVAGTAFRAPYIIKQNIQLIGIKNGVNNIFTTPDKFLQGIGESGNIFDITILHNGRNVFNIQDFIVAESYGAGSGFDTIIFTSFIPTSTSVLYCNYAVKN